VYSPTAKFNASAEGDAPRGDSLSLIKGGLKKARFMESLRASMAQTDFEIGVSLRHSRYLSL